MITVGIRFQDDTEQIIDQIDNVDSANQKLAESVTLNDVKYAFLEMDTYDPSIGAVVTDRYARLYP